MSFTEFQILQTGLAYDIFAHKLDYSLFDKECENESFEQVSRDLYFQGGIISDLEKRLGKNNKDILFRKKFYTLIELEHFEFVNTLNDKCDSDIRTILFFYSNEDEDIENAEKLGRLLSVVNGRNQKLHIYSFDVNLESELITDLKNHYGIESPQTIVINQKNILVNPENIDEIERYLD